MAHSNNVTSKRGGAQRAAFLHPCMLLQGYAYIETTQLQALMRAPQGAAIPSIAVF